MKLRRAAKRLARGGRPPEPHAAEEPCIPCGKQAGIRAFSLNEIDVEAVADDLVLRLTPDVEFAAVHGEVVLFDPARSSGTLLNSSASLIWASIEDGTTVSRLIDLLVEETQAERAVIDRDVRDTVARFIAGGILVRPVDPTDDPPPPPAPAATAPSSRDERRAARIRAVLERMTWFGDGEPRRCSRASVLVRASTPELAAALAPALAALPTSSGDGATTLSVVERNGGRRIEILVGTEVGGRATSVPGAVAIALSALDDLAAGETHDRLVLHAGAVERDGRVAVIVGRSGAGKSTLTAHLVQQGFAYLSDEVAAVDPADGAVTPYPKALGLHDDALDLLGLAQLRTDDPGKSRVLPAELGRVATGGHLALIVLLTDDPEDPDRPTSAATHLLDLLGSCFASTFAPATRPHEPLEALASLVATGPVLRLPRGALDDAGRAVAAAVAAAT